MVGFRSGRLHLLPMPRNLHSLLRTARKDEIPIDTSCHSQPLELQQFLPEVLKHTVRTRGCTAKMTQGSIHTSSHSLQWQRCLHQQLTQSCIRPRIARSLKEPTYTSLVAAFSPSSAVMLQFPLRMTPCSQAPEVAHTWRNRRCCSMMGLRAIGMMLCNRSDLFLQREVLLTYTGLNRLDSSWHTLVYIPKMALAPTGTSWHMRNHRNSQAHSHCTLAHTAETPGEPIYTNQLQGRVEQTTETGVSSSLSKLSKLQCTIDDSLT